LQGKSLNHKKQSENYSDRKEELRGLFVLGLLAVMVAIKLQHEKDGIMISFGQISFNLIPILDITILLWSLYAFFMVVGLSNDVLGETVSEGFAMLAKTFLLFAFLLLALLSILLGYAAYQNRLLWSVGLILFLSLCVGIMSMIDSRRRKRRIRPSFNKCKQYLPVILMAILCLCLAAIMYIPDEQYIPLPFAIGSVVSVFLVLSIRKKKREAKQTSSS